MTLFSQKPYFVFFLLSFFFCLILCSSCEKTTTQPPPPAGPDTTSHEFVWEIMQFGRASSSTLNDVAIIDENNIWAVGEIHTAETDTFDSLGNWVPPYNAVHWNGSEWELKRIRTNACGGVDYPPIEAIFAFSANDILFAHIDGSLTHFDGNHFTNDCSLIIQLNGSAKKIWGLSKDNFYVVSGNGFIAHYDGSSWQKLDSGTDLPIQDIWGCRNDQTGKFEILCVGSKHLQDPNFRRVIFKIQNGTLTELSSSPIHWTLYSIWFVPGKRYYVVGGGLYEKHHLDDQWRQIHNIAQHYTYRIRGNNINDVVAVGGFGEIVHFNGATWKNYIDQTRVSGNYYAVDIKDALIAAVGYHGRSAVIVIGRRH